MSLLPPAISLPSSSSFSGVWNRLQSPSPRSERTAYHHPPRRLRAPWSSNRCTTSLRAIVVHHICKLSIEELFSCPHQVLIFSESSSRLRGRRALEYHISMKYIIMMFTELTISTSCATSVSITITNFHTAVSRWNIRRDGRLWISEMKPQSGPRGT